MTIGKRIKYFRNTAGLTQRELGIKIGFPEENADVRIAQYESGTRKPHYNIIKRLAKAFEISVNILDAPDVDIHDPDRIIGILVSLEDEGIIHFRDNAIVIDTEDKKLRKLLDEWELAHGIFVETDMYDQLRYSLESRGDRDD